MNTVEVREVTAGRGAEWLTEGWALFKKAPGIWIAVIVLWLLILFAAGLIPFIGSLAMNLIAPVFTAGVCMGCRDLDKGEPLRVGHLFAAFGGDRLGPLIVVGAIGMGGAVLLVLLAMLFGLGATMAGVGHMGGSDAPHFGPGMLLGLLLILALAIPWGMALFFAAPLVALDGVAPVDSIKLSFGACLRNFAALLVWGLLALVLMIVASIPLMLGWLVAGPLLFASYYRIYRDCFAAPSP